MVKAQGYYRAGLGCATQNLTLQIPAIAPSFPEILNYYAATVNVCFEPKIIVAGSDHRTAPIPWIRDQPQGEVFDLVRVRLLFIDLDTEVQALMYVAHWSPFRHDPHMHEFLAERFIEGLQQGMTVVMECDRDSVELAYTARYEPPGSKLRLARTLVIL